MNRVQVSLLDATVSFPPCARTSWISSMRMPKPPPNRPRAKSSTSSILDRTSYGLKLRLFATSDLHSRRELTTGKSSVQWLWMYLEAATSNPAQRRVVEPPLFVCRGFELPHQAASRDKGFLDRLSLLRPGEIRTADHLVRRRRSKEAQKP